MIRTSFPHLQFCGLLALTAASFCAGAHSPAAKAPLPVQKIYSPAQEASALDALNDTLGHLDQLDQKLLRAYIDDGVPIIRMERVKQGPVLQDGPALVGDDYAQAAPVAPKRPAKSPPVPVSALSAPGGALIRRIASLEPLTSACGLANESIQTLMIISDQTGALLEKRKVATPADRTEWMAMGQADGSQRLAQVHELNCAGVRTALKETLSEFQSTYAKVYGAWKQDPELDPTPVLAPGAAPVTTVAVAPPLAKVSP
jgi:hypothetical protein